MKFFNIGKYPIHIQGVGEVGVDESFDCDRYEWDRQANIARYDDKTKQGTKPTRAEILAVESISDLRSLVRTYGIVGRSRLAIVEKALEFFSYAPLSDDEEEEVS